MRREGGGSRERAEGAAGRSAARAAATIGAVRARGTRLVAVAALVTIVGALAEGCGGDRPPLPGGRRAATPPADSAVPPPEVPGQSDEFKQMEVPPGQLTRALPVGTAWPKDEGPAYQSLCLQCHAVSQTSFAVTDWQESLHARAGVLCGSCHGTHEASFVPQPGPDRCALCHTVQVEEFLRSRHGPETSPGMRCVSCHEAHATDRKLAKARTVCLGCHLDSDHVQGFPASRMGLVLLEHPPAEDGSLRAADCVTCHMPESALMRETGDFRNDRVTLHDPTITLARDPADSTSLTPEAIEYLVPVCTQCHSERNTRWRLEHADPVILKWTPLGMPEPVRQRPVVPGAGAGAGAGASGRGGGGASAPGGAAR